MVGAGNRKVSPSRARREINLRNLDGVNWDFGQKIELPANPDVRVADVLGALFAAALEGHERFLDNVKEEVVEGSEYAQYTSTYDMARAIFKEEYTEDVRALMDSFDANPVTVAKSANGTGKTHCAARLALCTLLRHPDSKIFTAAAPPEDNLKKLLWGEIGSLALGHPELLDPDRFNVSVAGMHIERRRNPQSFLTGVTIPATGTDKEREARFSGKHAPVIVFILDEGDAIPWAVYKGIESCLSGGYGRLLILFNPRQQVGPVYQMEKDQQANIVQLTAFRHPNVVTGEEVFPGAVSRNMTGRRILQWTRALAPGEKRTSSCFEVPDFLVGYVPTSQSGKPMEPIPAGWREVVEHEFSYMVLAEYPAAGQRQLINRAHIERATENWKHLVMKYGLGLLTRRNPVLGLDVAEYGPDSNILTPSYGSFVAEQIAWGGVDPLETAQIAAQHFHDLGALYCNVDGTGVGSGVAPAMMRVYNCDRCYSIKAASSPPEEFMSEEQLGLGEFRNMRDYFLWNLRVWLKTDMEAALPPDPLLVEELLAFSYEIDRGKIKVTPTDEIREKIRRSPDRAMSLALARMGEIDMEEDEGGEVTSQSYI